MRRTIVCGLSCASLAALAPLARQVTGEVEAAEPEPPPVERYEGTLADGLHEIERLTAEAKHAEALALASAVLAPTDFLRWRRELEVEGSRFVAPLLDLVDPLIAWLGLDGYPEPIRAEVHYAEGLVRRAADERDEAALAFEEARALAGPGELRLAAMYNRGLTVLEVAEELRLQIPEIQGASQALAPAQPPVPAAPPGAGMPGQAPAPEDPLQLARQAYLRAKEHLVERLRADWRDPDTRANVELVQRRLKELDEIEKKREEEKQEQEQDEQQKQDPQQPNPQDQQNEDQKNDDEQKSEEQKEEEQKSDEQQDPQQQDEPQDPEQQEEPQPEEEKAEQQEAQEPQEVFLTREEMQRLLERLREHEEEGQVVKERLHQNARKGVRRDW